VGVCNEQKSNRLYGTIGSCVPLGMSPVKPGSGLGFDLVASGVVLAQGSGGRYTGTFPWFLL
jgi:hypothetical protein